MDMTGEVRIPATREVVWAALNNPAVLQACIPGCEALQALSATQMTAVVMIRVGPIASRFSCAVTLDELDPPRRYRITGEGQGGVAGHARGSAVVRLAADGAHTVLSYAFSAQVGGKMAQLGSRMIDATAKTLSAAFFRNLAAQIAPPPLEDAARAPAPAAPPAAPGPASVPPAATPMAAPARTAATEPARTGRRIAVAALAVALLALALAWRALTGGPASGVAAVPTAPTEFHAAVQLLIVLAVGFLLGRTTTAGRPG